jgi:hypothetical protein
MPIDERSLVERAVRRDTQAFALLYDQYVEKIYRYIHYKVARGPKLTSTRVPALPPTQPRASETPRAIERLRATATLVAPPLPVQPTLTTTIPITVPTFIPPGQVPKLTVVPPGLGGSDQRGHEE